MEIRILSRSGCLRSAAIEQRRGLTTSERSGTFSPSTPARAVESRSHLSAILGDRSLMLCVRFAAFFPLLWYGAGFREAGGPAPTEALSFWPLGAA